MKELSSTSYTQGSFSKRRDILCSIFTSSLFGKLGRTILVCSGRPRGIVGEFDIEIASRFVCYFGKVRALCFVPSQRALSRF